MKLKFYTEQVLTVLLVVILLPCAITLLLNSRMSRIYQAIQDETKYISIESGDKTEEISLEEYVLEVTASELPADAQLEAIKAQMVLVRTNAYRQLQNGGIRPKETKGEILTWQGKPILASCHPVSAGQTREAREVFRSEDYPYLTGKACPGDKDAPQYRQSIQIDESWRNMEIEEKDSAGYVLRLKLNNTEMSGEEFRIKLGLPS